jgi:DCN1-like protein 1/2
MTYLSQELKVNLEDAELLVALEVVQAPTVGEITRKGYIEGWKVTGYANALDARGRSS